MENETVIILFTSLSVVVTLAVLVIVTLSPLYRRPNQAASVARAANDQNEPRLLPDELARIESERTKGEIERQEYQRVIQELSKDFQVLAEQLKGAGIEPARKLNGVQTRAANGELPAVELVNLMEQAFDRDDLDDILLQMGIDPGAISGETLVGKMRNLVRYCQRRGRLADLVAVCRKERPRITWPHVE